MKQFSIRPLRAMLMLAGALIAQTAGTAHAGSVVYTYDSLGRLSTATYGSVVVKYNYDAAGNRTSVVVTGA